MTPAQFKEARNRLGLSQAQLAELWGMGENGGRTIRRWESGERPMNPIAAHDLGLMLDYEEIKFQMRKVEVATSVFRRLREMGAVGGDK